MQTTLPELSRRVSEAEGPSRELDLLVFKAFHAKYDSDDWVPYGGGLRHKMDGSDARCLPPPEATPPRYTASLDAVAALIVEKLPGYGGRVTIGAMISPEAWLAPPGGTQENSRWNWLGDKDVSAKTHVNALLAAALLAIHERNKSDDN